ncbi:protein YIPF3-like [Euwallacea similis]|uniref:protein YIPF3-like n=1 Tax=Euwallacea similis TaxID=1736056 RepID=UPI00344C23A3
MSSSVIFIGSPDRSIKKSQKQYENYYGLFVVSPADLLFRIFASFIPPFGSKYRKVHVDFLGPLLALFSLNALLIYGYSFKKIKISLTPLESMLTYYTCVPLLSFILAKLGRSSVNFCETLSLLGYSLYGHLFTLLLSFILFHETSNAFFFGSLVVFAGASSLRLILVFLNTIPVPAARLLVCSTISTVNILFLIYLHFGFMHRTFS